MNVDLCVDTVIARPTRSGYVGRFAPSPTGPMHMGSLAAAMASYLDAKAHRGKWLVRIEDLDFDRNVPGAAHQILETLKRCGMHWDDEVVWQSAHIAHYASALYSLAQHVYPCACSRKEIADSNQRRGDLPHQIYPGTCRDGIDADRPPRSWRVRVPQTTDGIIHYEDRYLGLMQQDLRNEIGDFILKRADGFWAYQLAVVVDDAAQGITDVVRGQDLLDSTARQIYLQRLLNLPPVRYLHIPVVTNHNGEKLSKQSGAQAFDQGNSEAELLRAALLPAAQFLGLVIPSADSINDIGEFWRHAELAWSAKIAVQI